MKYCAECGMKNDETIAFCGECGFKFDTESEQARPNVMLNKASNFFHFKKNDSKKGVIFVVGGIVALFILPIVFKYLFSHLLGDYYYEFYRFFDILPRLISLALLIFGIIILVKNSNAKNTTASFELTDKESFNNENINTNSISTSEIINSENKETFTKDMKFQNKVVKVSLTGGIIGWVSQNETEKLNNTIKTCNQNGWEVVQILEDKSSNLIISVLRALLLLITAFLFTFENGFKIVLRKAK